MRKIIILVTCNIVLLSGCNPKPKEPVVPVRPAIVPVRHYADCGINLLDCKVTGTINRGIVAKENAYPWLVYIYQFDRESDFGIDVNDLDLPESCKTTSRTKNEPTGRICGGSLITPRYVMTAAHCVACRTVNDTAVVLGENIVDVEFNYWNTNFVLLSNIHIYPKYKRGVKEDLKNNPDVALLQLEFAVEFGPTINAICLPTSPERLYEDEPMVIAGWGGTENNKISSKKLMETNVKVYPNKKCKTVGGYKFLESFHLCTYDEEGRSHCGGDSGGPLMMVDTQDCESGRYTQTAVASFGPRRNTDCGHKPAGFTRLTPEVLDWVKKTAGIYHPGISNPAVLITGGGDGARQSAEVYHPDRHTPCVLRGVTGVTGVTDYTSHHTQDGKLLCGGIYTPGRSCWRWNADSGAWDLVIKSLLIEQRYGHVSWTPVDGSVTYLMGGHVSMKTSEVIDKDNGVTSSFPLKHSTWEACAIPDPDTDTVLVTGGYHTLTTVSRYGQQGWKEDFSSGLRTGRKSHGCSSFLTKDNERVLLVTGGRDSSDENLSSTEVYRPSNGEWREVPGGALPRPMQDVSVVTLNNRVFLFGGSDKNYDGYADIIEYSDEKRKWTRVGQMSSKRWDHAVSIVEFDDFNNYCQLSVPITDVFSKE